MLLPTVVLLVVMVSLDVAALMNAQAVDAASKSTTTTTKKKDIASTADRDGDQTSQPSTTSKPESSRRYGRGGGRGEYYDSNGLGEGYQGHGYGRPRSSLRSSGGSAAAQAVRNVGDRYRLGYVNQRNGRSYVRVEVEQPLVMGRTEGDGYGTYNSPVYSYAPGYPGPSSSSSSSDYDRESYDNYEREYNDGYAPLAYISSRPRPPPPPSSYDGYRPSSSLIRRPLSSRYGPAPPSSYGPVSYGPSSSDGGYEQSSSDGGYRPSSSDDGYAPSSSGGGYGPSSSSDGYGPSSSSDGYRPSSSGYGTPSSSGGAILGTSYTVLDGPNYQEGGTGSEYIIRGSGPFPPATSSNGYTDNRPPPQYGYGSSADDRPDTPTYTNTDNGYQGSGGSSSSNNNNNGPIAGTYESVTNSRPQQGPAEYNGNREDTNYGQSQSGQNQDNEPFVSVNQNFGAQHSGSYVQESSQTNQDQTNNDDNNNNGNNNSSPASTVTSSSSSSSGRNFNRNYAGGRRGGGDDSLNAGRMGTAYAPLSSTLFPNAFLSTVIYRR